MKMTGRAARVFVCALAMVLAFGMMGLSACSSNSSDNAATQPTSNAATDSIEALLVSFNGNSIVAEYEGQQYAMDLSQASINTSTLHVGDMLIIGYTGELKLDDSSAYTVVSVETKDEGNDAHEVVGTLEDITMDAITLRTIDGQRLTFNTNNAQHSFYYGVGEGNWVTVVYRGSLVGNNTSDVAVVRIHDLDTDHVREVKAQTTITDATGTFYALEDADVRSSYMMASESLGTLKAHSEVQVTGHCNNGWDRIIFNGGEAYVYGKLLTANANESGSQGTMTSAAQAVTIKQLDETVYARSTVNVREGYSTSSRAIGQLAAGAAVTRTGICSNGWSRIIFNGKVAYVFSDLLTTKNPNATQDGVTVTTVGENVYIAGDTADIHVAWTNDSQTIATLKKGDAVTRTGICSNGWSRILYNNQVAYVNSNLISKTDPTATEVTVYRVNSYSWLVADTDAHESWSTDSKVLGQLKSGQGVKVTGITNNNWTRIEYNGTVAFVHSDLLTSQDPNPKDTQEEAEDAAGGTPAPAPKDDTTQDDTDEQGTDESTTPDTTPDDEGTAPEADESNAQDSEQQAQDDTQDVTENTETIEGIVVGYDTNTITIQVDNDAVAVTAIDRPAEEPAQAGQDGEYPSLTYDEAQGSESTYLTFKLDGAVQDFARGIDEGMTVKISYTGSLDDMDSVVVKKVESVASNESVYRGVVSSRTANTVTVIVDGYTTSTFNIEGVSFDNDKLAPGAQVAISCNVDAAASGDNILKATKIVIEAVPDATEESGSGQ